MSGMSVRVTGMGIATPVATGCRSYTAAISKGETRFSILSMESGGEIFRFPFSGLETSSFQPLTETLQLDGDIIRKAKQFRHISHSTRTGLYCALEAWSDAGLNGDNTDLSRVAVISCGSNTQHAMYKDIMDNYHDKLRFINPAYGFGFFDTDIVGVLSELLKIRGEGHCIGAASASGNMGIINGCRLLLGGEYDVVLVVAPLMDLSVFEYQAIAALGAMAPVADVPSAICRPFDRMHNGFVYGQSAGCMILESETHAAARNRSAYGTIRGYGVCMDANRNPNPSAAGEKTAIIKAITAANLTPAQISYVNTHGTGSKAGDLAEVEAILGAGLAGVRANSTKSLIGHGLSAAGVVEAITTLLQMNGGFLHPTSNLDNPVSNEIDWVRGTMIEAGIEYAVSNGFGFGGINTAIVLSKD
ncbi:beta-ketoacyl synthase N-terminal-like domain-containing protein [Chitinophaga sp. 22536]|uniref:beta-ketoacyl synthase N-terminal-like domain-containing protein n=1 Tax=unclassified Chitinophaga TaxID=2619133 RepID=UPI003F874D21